MAKLKIFNGRIVHGVYSEDGKFHKQTRGIMASTSQKKVADAAYVGVGEIRTYWSETGNKVSIRLAMQHPEKLIIIEDRYTDVPVVIDIVDCITDNWKKREGE